MPSLPEDDTPFVLGCTQAEIGVVCYRSSVARQLVTSGCSFGFV
jgi:hypothetical protein